MWSSAKKVGPHNPLLDSRRCYDSSADIYNSFFQHISHSTPEWHSVTLLHRYTLLYENLYHHTCLSLKVVKVQSAEFEYPFQYRRTHPKSLSVNWSSHTPYSSLKLGKNVTTQAHYEGNGIFRELYNVKTYEKLFRHVKHPWSIIPWLQDKIQHILKEISIRSLAKCRVSFKRWKHFTAHSRYKRVDFVHTNMPMHTLN